MMTLNAHFDGKTIVLDEPASLPFESGTRLRVQIEPLDEKPVLDCSTRRFQPLNIHISPKLSQSIALDPAFNIEEC